MMRWFRYRHTNCWIVESGRDGGLLAVDAGWPCSLAEYRRGMKSVGFRFDNLKAAIVTHFHMDHAGLVGEFIGLGIRCYAFEGQAESIGLMERMILKNPDYAGYRRIDMSRLVGVGVGAFGRELESLGFGGQVLATPGHGPDNISYLSDEGVAAIGDLYLPDQIADDDPVSRASWDLLRSKGARRIIPSHAQVFELEPASGGSDSLSLAATATGTAAAAGSAAHSVWNPGEGNP